MSYEPTDDVARALALLAHRADAAPVADRVGAVHRRARRAAQRRTAGVVVALVLAVGGAGWAVGRGVGADRGGGPAVTPGEVLDVVQVADPAVVDPAAAPFEGTGARTVVVEVRVRGAFRRTLAEGEAPLAGAVSPQSHYALRVDQPGLGYTGVSEAPVCAPDAPIDAGVETREMFTLRYDPDAPPSAEVVVTLSACEPVGTVTRRITVTVPPAASPSG